MSQLLQEFIDVKAAIDRLEKRKKELSIAMKEQYPEPGVFGDYRVKWGRQDRRKIDEARMTALAIEKEAPAEMFRSVFVMDNLPKLVESEIVTAEEVQSCFTGTIVHFPQVELAKEILPE